MTGTPREPLDLCATLRARLGRVTFLKPLRLTILSDAECSALDEGTSSSFSQGVRLADAVAIFLDWWGWGRPHNRYSFAVFEQTPEGWQHVCSRIESLDVALATALHTLAERALAAAGSK